MRKTIIHFFTKQGEPVWREKTAGEELAELIEQQTYKEPKIDPREEEASEGWRDDQ